MGMMNIEVIALPALFAAGAAENARLDVDIPIPRSLGSGYGSARCKINSLVIVSADNHAWEVAFWSSAARSSLAAPNTWNTWLGSWPFTVGDGVQYGATGSFYYYEPNFDLPYRDDDAGANLATYPNNVVGLIHISLVDRTGTFTAGHSLLLKLYCQPEAYEGA
jgi:hypothetical protein